MSGYLTFLPIAAVSGTLLLLGPLVASAAEPTIEAEAAPPQAAQAPANLAPFGSTRAAPGSTIPLHVTPPASAERVPATVIILGAPKGARITDGSNDLVTQVEDETVDTSGWDLSKLAMELPAEVTGHFMISAFAISAPEGGDRKSAAQSLLNLVLDVQAGTAAKESTREDVTAQKTTTPPPMSPQNDKDGPSRGPAVNQGAGAAAAGERGPATLATSAKARPGGPADLRADQPPMDGTLSAKEGGRKLSSEAGAQPPAEAEPASLPPVEGAPLGGISEPNATTLVERAQRLIRLGDVSGARLVLERAVARGDPRAAFFLAQTFDARVLRTWNVRGMPADQERAQELYAKAEQGGISGAKIMGEAMPR